MKPLILLALAAPLLQGCVALVAGTAATSVMVAQDKRTTGTIVEDKTIQLKAINSIKDIMQTNPNAHVGAVSYNNRVLLVGQVPNQHLRKSIEESIRTIDKVKFVHNEMTVGKPISIKQRSVDSFITGKIKSEMALTKEINMGRVKVITEDGIVYLMGIVRKVEEEIAIDIARHTKGVEKVVKIFEYEAS